MPPKKKEEAPKEKPILGRFSSHLKMGIVGMPNVGKSTLFNTLTKMGIPAENFPFCTIEPNEARVNVPDERFTWLVDLYKPKSQVSAYLEIHDIAGLVRGAAEGQGLGNAFLSHIRRTDGIFHVCRCFEDADVVHVEDRIDPVGDLEIIASELRAKDLEQVKKEIFGYEKKNQKLTKDETDKLASLKKIEKCLEDGINIKDSPEEWSIKDVDLINELQPLTSKPAVYLCNMSEKDYARKKNKFLAKLHAWVQAHGGGPMIPFSAALEENLVMMQSDEEREAYCKEMGVQSALPKIITTGFSAIQLIYFFTAGADEVKCWSIRKGYKAPQAAGTIHTDFERGFICAEVMKYADLKELGTEAEVKNKGKYKQEGKTYVVEDGDIIHFKFNVTSKGK